jgi:YD repeat-containing protein
VDQLGRTNIYVYDDLNRLKQTIFPDNTANSTVYDDLGRVVFSIDARAFTNAFGYDAAGHRTAVTNAWGVSGAQMTNGYTFDGNGNQVTFTDGLRRTTTTVFDLLNRPIQVSYPDGTTTFSGYDAGGRRTAETNQDVVVTRFGYDGAGRLTAVTNAYGRGQFVTQYQYDEAGNETAQIDALSLEGDSEDPRSLHRYLYCRGDPANRIDPNGQLDFSDVMATMETIGAMACNIAIRAVACLSTTTTRPCGSNHLLQQGASAMGRVSSDQRRVSDPQWTNNVLSAAVPSFSLL